MRVFGLIVVLVLTLAGAVRAQPAEDLLFRPFDARQLSQDDKRVLQAALAFGGFYNGLLDGAWGPISQRAIERFAQTSDGAGVEVWHAAVLTADFLAKVEDDGWELEFVDWLNQSLLIPTRAIDAHPDTALFVNWSHSRSSLSYSAGVHPAAEALGFHDYTLGRAAPGREPYVLRRAGLAITSATLPDGTTLYTRSDQIGTGWATVILSAGPQDATLLNVVAASVAPGYVPPLRVTPNGGLHRSVDLALQHLAAQEQAPAPAPVKRPPGAAGTDGGRTGGSGTGFVVSPEGHILTNAHVVDGCRTLRFDDTPVRELARSGDLDLALLKLDGAERLPFAEFAPAPSALNSDVTVVGFPLSNVLSGLNVTRGSVSALLGLGGDPAQMQITAPVQPGNSGGPVLLAQGTVVGVIVSKLNARVIEEMTGDIPQNVNFAIRGELAKLFLAQNGVSPAIGLGTDPLPPEAVAALAQGYTGALRCDF